MGIGVLLTEITSAAVSALQTFLPGVANAFVSTFDAVAFTGTGDDTQMTAAFGWIVIGSVITLGGWALKKLTHKAFGGGRL